MIQWLKKWFGKGKSSEAAPSKAEIRKIEALVRFLSQKAGTSETSRQLLDAVEQYLAGGDKEKAHRLPHIYLMLEKYLTHSNRAHQLDLISLRKMVREYYSSLLDQPEFSLVFEDKTNQEFHLCRQFLLKVIDEVLPIMGRADRQLLTRTQTMISEAPIAPSEASPFPDLPLPQSALESWRVFMIGLSARLYTMIADKMGESAASRIFDMIYLFLAEQYTELDSFGLVLNMLPDSLINEERISKLSRTQAHGLLLQKIRYLESLNDELKDKNEALSEYQSKLKLAITETETSRKLLDAVIQTVNEGVITMDTNHQIVMVNRLVGKMWDYTKDELIGQPLTSLFEINDPSDHLIFRGGDISSILDRRVRLVGKRKDDSNFPLEIIISETLHEGQLLFTIAANDISERLEIEHQRQRANEILEERVAQRTTELEKAQNALEQHAAELSRSNQELEQFAYVASHDLQEPIRTIVSFSQLLLSTEGDNLGEESKEYLDFIISGGIRMRDLIRELLQFSRVGRHKIYKETIEVKEVMEQVIDNLYNKIEETGAKICFEDLPAVIADESQMVQLFQNLIENAIKFCGDKEPIVKVSATSMEDYWQFSVQDQGIGISEAFQERIFVIFERLHSQEESGGAGIGLAICKKIVERHHGRIWVESDGQNGSSFFFTIEKEPVVAVNEKLEMENE